MLKILLGIMYLHITLPYGSLEMADEKLKIHQSPSMDQMLAEMIKAIGREIHSEICTLINSIGIRRNCLSRGMSLHREGDKKTDCSNYRGISLLPTM
jgi:hypothetical protein